MAKIISFLSGKGGTGKSTMASSLASSLARLGCSVLAVDLDIGLRSLDLLLGMENRLIFDLGDVLEGRCTLEQAMVSHERFKRLRLLCAPSDVAKTFQIPAVTALLREAARQFDYILLDLPAGIGLSIILSKELADLSVFVTVPDLVTLRDSRKTVDVLLSNCRKPCRLIINRVSRDTLLSSGVHDLDEVMDIVGIPLLGVVPLDPYVNSAAPGQKRSRRRDPFTQKVFDAMARRIVGEYVPILMRTV